MTRRAAKKAALLEQDNLQAVELKAPALIAGAFFFCVGLNHLAKEKSSLCPTDRAMVPLTGASSPCRREPKVIFCVRGAISPLLVNLYMNRFLKYWRLTGRTAALSAQVVAYADDFVIVSRGHAAESLAWAKVVMRKLGLTLNEAKTSVRNARVEHFNFLGYTFGPHRHWKTGRQYLGASPSNTASIPG